MAGSQSPEPDKWWQRLLGISNKPYNTESATEYQVKKYLLLLATLVATVTYAAGLNVPGGAWLEDDLREGHLAGDSILRDTSFTRYIVFYYFNAISFTASLMVGLLLLIVHKDDQEYGNWLLLQLVRTVMVVDLLGLLGAYAVGSSHDRFTTVCGATVIVSGVITYATVALITKWLLNRKNSHTLPPSVDAIAEGQKVTEMFRKKKKKVTEKQHEILLVLAIFAATIGYVAGLNPPGGFWRSTEEGHHAAGDPVLQGLHRTRYRVFFFFNTTGFVASLLAIMLVVSFDKLKYEEQKRIEGRVTKLALYGPIVMALLGLGGAYASGSCRDIKHTFYIVLVAASVFLLLFVDQIATRRNSNNREKLPTKTRELTSGSDKTQTDGGDKVPNYWEKNYWAKTREDLQLLAILVATIAYTAGVDPPGGVWAESGHGHNVGDPILLTTHPVRYKIFFYCNSAALVASLVIMVMLLSDRLVQKHALEAVMILDLFALIGAFATGGARDTTTSVYTVALAGVVLIYVVIHIVFFTLDTPAPVAMPAAATSGSNAAAEGEKLDDEQEQQLQNKSGDVQRPTTPAQKGKKKVYTEEEGQLMKEEKQLQKRRDVLLLLAILAATLTYQAGLTPPGGTWEEGGNAGLPVLLDKFRLRYKLFYYCNAASFMASVALIVLLLNQNLYKPGIRCYALYVCMVAGMLGLMGAYSAGSSLHLKTSIVVLVLGSLLTVAAFAVAFYVKKRNDKKAKQNKATGVKKRNDEKAKQNKGTGGPKTDDDDEEEDGAGDISDMMYLMLVGILGASVTYLTGLKPPGGTWREDRDGHAAGNPVLYDISKRRYNSFFYCNSISFMTSINIIAWLLVRMIRGDRQKGQAGRVVHLSPLFRAMLLDLLALVCAYAAGSARKWRTSTKVVVMLGPVVFLVWLVFFFCDKKNKPEQPQELDSQNAVTS